LRFINNSALFANGKISEDKLFLTVLSDRLITVDSAIEELEKFIFVQ